ncbi:MAG: hypothetical protein ACI9XO_003350 [Paraglaciecola sp.]
MSTYFENLNQEIKEELVMLLDDRIVDELYLYLKSMVNFYKDCLHSQNEMIVIANA